jgi:hypothetical protein
MSKNLHSEQAHGQACICNRLDPQGRCGQRPRRCWIYGSGACLNEIAESDLHELLQKSIRGVARVGTEIELHRDDERCADSGEKTRLVEHQS